MSQYHLSTGQHQLQWVNGLRPSYNRRAHITHTRNIPRTSNLRDQEDCTTGPSGHLLQKAIPLLILGKVDLETLGWLWSRGHILPVSAEPCCPKPGDPLTLSTQPGHIDILSQPCGRVRGVWPAWGHATAFLHKDSGGNPSNLKGDLSRQ